MNSVLQGEDRGGRARRLTVFDNGTLLVPAVGIGEEGEYTCYAENQGGQDSMKVRKTFSPGEDLRTLIYFINLVSNLHIHITHKIHKIQIHSVIDSFLHSNSIL